jgi:hypothetical protein
MSQMEWYLLGVAVVGLVVWARGCVKRSVGTCVLGLLLGVVAAAAYFAAFSLTRTSYFAVWLMAPFLVVLLLFHVWARTSAGKALAGSVIVLAGLAALAEFELVSTGNAMLVIEPYRSGAEWRFDEPLLHLKAEPFVQGMSQMIDKMVQGLPGSDKSVRLIFSQRPFPGWQYRLDRRREEDGGNWYYNEQYQMEGWLCPALFKFFPRAPQYIYACAEAK